MTSLRARYMRLLAEAGLDEYQHFVRTKFQEFQKNLSEGVDPELLDAVAAISRFISEPDFLTLLNESYSHLSLPSLDKDIYFGLFPTPTLNAELVNLESEGYLGLLHGGLTGLIAVAVEAVVYSSVSHTPDGRRVPPLMTLQEAALVVRKAVEAVRRGWGGTGVDPTPKQLSELIWILETSAAGVSFVVMHEWAHAWKGHLEEAEPVRLATPSGDFWVNRASIEQEWEADTVAAGWVVGQVQERSRELSEDARGVLIPPLLAGPLIVLMLIAWSEEGGHSPRVVTHPPGAERLLELRNRLHREMTNTLEFRRAWNFVSHLESLGLASGVTGRQFFGLGERPQEGPYIEIVQGEKGIQLRQPRE